jgi:hypothetical protein
MEEVVRKDEVLELYRRTDEVPFHKAPEEWLNAIQKFRVPARKYKLEGDGVALLAAVDAYGAALLAVSAFTEMVAAQVTGAEAVVVASVPPITVPSEAPVVVWDACKETNQGHARGAAKVFQAVRGALDDHDIAIANNMGEHLAAISEADPTDWQPMVHACIAEKWTVARTREEVAQLTVSTAKDVTPVVEPEVKRATVMKPVLEHVDPTKKLSEPTKPSVAKTTGNTENKSGQGETAGKVSSTPDEQMHYLVIALALKLKTLLDNARAVDPTEVPSVRAMLEDFLADPVMRALVDRSALDLAKMVLRAYGKVNEEYLQAG